MKTSHTPATARFQTGLIVATACLGLLAVALVFPLRASNAMPAMPSASASQMPAQAMPMPAGGISTTRFREVGAIWAIFFELRQGLRFRNSSFFLSSAADVHRPGALGLSDFDAVLAIFDTPRRQDFKLPHAMLKHGVHVFA